MPSTLLEAKTTDEIVCKVKWSASKHFKTDDKPHGTQNTEIHKRRCMNRQKKARINDFGH